MKNEFVYHLFVARSAHTVQDSFAYLFVFLLGRMEASNNNTTTKADGGSSRVSVVVGAQETNQPVHGARRFLSPPPQHTQRGLLLFILAPHSRLVPFVSVLLLAAAGPVVYLPRP
jgi:hypothetical protein